LYSIWHFTRRILERLRAKIDVSFNRSGLETGGREKDIGGKSGTVFAADCRCSAKALPTASKLVEEVNKLVPAIVSLLGL
jgi:hypothetical protein